MHPRPPANDFVGRRAEMAVLERALADARRGLPSVVLLSGEAGIGKTTIVTEGAARSGVNLYLGRSTHIGGDTIPLAPLADLLRQVRRTRPDLLSETASLAVLHDWSSPSRQAPALDGSSHGGLFAAVLELVDHLADEVVIVGFEDLHWADTVTWDLFEYLARNLIDERVVLVGTYRDDEVAIHPAQRSRLGELQRLPAAKRLHVEGLQRDEIATRVSSLLGTSAPEGLVDQVVDRGRGNPFFTNELVAAHLSGEAIPLVLSDLISAEIADLDDRSRLVLGACAAIGRATSHELLAVIVGLGDAELEATLRAVIGARLLVVDVETYRFRHPLLAEVVYADLLPPQRVRLHRNIAAALARQPANALRRADRAGELAFHLDRSGDSEAAFAALLEAADAAETVAPAAAFRHLERAFELWDAVGAHPPEPSRADRLWQAAELASSTVGADRAVQLARAALAAGVPAFGAAAAHEGLGRYLWINGQLADSRAEFERAAELSGGEVVGAADVFAGLAQAEVMSGHHSSARAWCERVFNLVPTPDINPAAWRVLGFAQSNLGDPNAGAAVCREAVAAATSTLSRTWAEVYRCIVLVDAGEYQAAVNAALDAVAEGQLSGLHSGFRCYYDALAVEGLTRLGRWPDAENILARHALDERTAVSLIRLCRAGALLAARQGRSERALALLAHADTLPVDGWHQSVLDATSADVHLALGNWHEAAQAADQGWAATGTTSALWAARFAMFGVVAEVERTLDQRARREPVDVAAAISRLDERLAAARSLARADGGGPQRDSAAHLAHAAASLTRLGAPDADAWAEAVARWDDLGDRWASAVARLREAEAAALLGAADRAAASLRAAHAIASGVQAAPLLAEIDRVSTRTRISIDPPARIEFDEISTERLGLTPREAEVLGLVASGRTNRQIGEELYVSDKTASVHVTNILRKLGVNSRIDAAAVAQRLGIA